MGEPNGRDRSETASFAPKARMLLA